MDEIQPLSEAGFTPTKTPIEDGGGFGKPVKKQEDRRTPVLHGSTLPPQMPFESDPSSTEAILARLSGVEAKPMTTHEGFVHQQGTFMSAAKIRNSDGLIARQPLFFQSWRPPNGVVPKGAIAIVHGVGEHSGRYAHVGERYAKMGYQVFAFDQMGFGKSPGIQGHLQSWSDFRSNIHSFLNIVDQAKATENLVLLGHSMGGLSAADYVLHQGDDRVKLKGVILSSPGMSDTIPGYKKKFANIVDKYLFWTPLTRLKVNTGIDFRILSHDTKVADAVRNDKLNHSYATPKFGAEFGKTQRAVIEHAGEFNLPMLWLHGTADRVVPCDDVRAKFYNFVPPEFQEKKEIVHGFHELFNELEAFRKPVFKAVDDKLAAWCPA